MIMPVDKPDDDVPQAALNELNRRLADMTHAHNTAPDPEMGGLSPEQVTRLLYSPWGEPGGAIQFNTAISLAELDTSTFFREARTLLRALLDSGGVRATSGKNLPRSFVSDVLPRVCDEQTVQKILRYRKTVNEEDIMPLHIARVVAQAAGLLRLRAGKFVVPRNTAALLPDEQAGELYRCLFVAFFRRFNLAYAHPFSIEAAGLQTCVGYTLYRLGIVAANWRPVAELPEQVLLPAVRAEIEDAIQGHVYWTLENVLVGRLLYFLLQWGLLEGRYAQVTKYTTDLKTVRITPLFKAFLLFRLPSPGSAT